MLVFSKEKYFKSMGVKRKKDIENWPFHWPSACDGTEVINGSCGCWNIADSWCIDTDKQSELDKLIPDNTRRESYKQIQPKIRPRQKDILEAMTFVRKVNDRGMTAREILRWLYNSRKAENCDDMNFVRPRINELKKQEMIKTVGTKKDPVTGKNVSLYQII